METTGWKLQYCVWQRCREELDWGVKVEILLKSMAVPLPLVFLCCEGRKCPSKALFPALSYPPKLQQEWKRRRELGRDTEQPFWPFPHEVCSGHPRTQMLLSPCRAAWRSSSLCLAVPQAGMGGRAQAGATPGWVCKWTVLLSWPTAGEMPGARLTLGTGLPSHIILKTAIIIIINTALVFKSWSQEVFKTCWAIRQLCKILCSNVVILSE